MEEEFEEEELEMWKYFNKENIPVMEIEIIDEKD